jgi:sugar phosphate permease
MPTLVQLGLGRGLWAACLPVVGWAGTSVVTSMLARRLPWSGPRAIAGFLVLVAAGQLVGWHLTDAHPLLRVVLCAVASGLGTGVLNAMLGREAVAAVPADAAAMGSGANNTARYLGAAVGITLFVTVATHTGGSPVAGWNAAVLVTVVVTLLGAALVALAGRER